MKQFLLSIVFIYCSSAAAVEVYTNYEERLGETRNLAPISGDEVFGAKVDSATGGAAFYVPILKITGNNDLDISVIYKLDIKKVANHTEWRFEQDEPYIGGTFSQERGWVTYSGSTSRCSQASGSGSKPPKVQSSNGRNGWFEPDEYWSGYQLSLPGGAGSSLAKLGSASPIPLPSSGGPIHWAANGNWYFSCIPLAIGTGEGYLGYSPDGLKYHFDTMRNDNLVELDKFDSSGKDLYLDRYEIRIYAGKIEDRFGNYISGLTASDGRVVTKTVAGSVVTFQYGTQQWTVNTSPPYTVTYPDGSQWKASITGTINDVGYTSTSCPSEAPNVSPGTTTATVTTPTGATGTYIFKQAKIGYSYVSHQCVGLEDLSVVSVQPNYFARTVLAQRTISGPGLPTSTLSIDYGAVNNCYTMTAQKCISSSPRIRVVKYAETSGKYRNYTYGNQAGVDADLLLKLEEGQSTSAPLRITEYTYTSLPRVGSYVGPGFSTSTYFPASSKRVVNVSRKIKEAGMVHEWAVLKTCGSSGSDYCIDDFGRPTKIIKSGKPGA